MRILSAAALAAVLACSTAAAETPARPISIVIHGGAGAMEKGRYTEAQEASYKAALAAALNAGYAVLEAGGSALDAVEAAVVMLEDDPQFNAGRGAVFTREGKNELDASIMEGRTLMAGAVAGVTRVKNPIRLARKVMENSPHVMFAREGAEVFAREQGLEFVPTSYFRTDARWKTYLDALEAEKKQLKESARPAEWRFGTVGAVALDRNGDLAAATSTGGMTLKRWGRVGDAPIIGAGTFADNRSCAVSSTGWGEYFIRFTVAREICAQVEYAGRSLEDASKDVIFNRVGAAGGDGGVIALAPNGDYAMVFNSKGMFRGVRREGEAARVAIYGDAD